MNAKNFPNSWNILGSLILGLGVYFGLSAGWPLSAQIAKASPRPPKTVQKPAPATNTSKNTVAPQASTTTQAPDESKLTNIILLLKEENRRLRLENERLKAENADLKAAQQ